MISARQDSHHRKLVAFKPSKDVTFNSDVQDSCFVSKLTLHVSRVNDEPLFVNGRGVSNENSCRMAAIPGKAERKYQQSYAITPPVNSIRHTHDTKSSQYDLHRNSLRSSNLGESGSYYTPFILPRASSGFPKTFVSPNFNCRGNFYPNHTEISSSYVGSNDNQRLNSFQIHPEQHQTNSGSPADVSSKSLSSSSCSGSQSMHSVSGSFPSPTLVRPRAKQQRVPLVDDADGHLAFVAGDVIADRYEVVVRSLGEGTFGRVAKCRDLQNNGSEVALKVVKNVAKYREAAKLEMNVLRTLNAADPDGAHLCVRMLDCFDYYGHVCFAFEVLGESVFDLLRSNNFEPYPLGQVRHISHQLSLAVAFMHDNGLTHTDLKPENVLFVSRDWMETYSPVRRRVMRDTRVKLIDFGSATFDWEHHSSVVSTRHYRAPEVILDLGWGHPCDVWSIGCIIFELHQGNTLFQTHDNREHLAMMEKVLERPMPQHMVSRTRTKFFDQQQLTLLWDPSSPEAKYTNQNCKSLLQHRRFDRNSREGREELDMYDLIENMLEYDPDVRIGLREALGHQFFQRLTA